MPATHIGAPEMITMTSLMPTEPSPRSARSISTIMSSVVSNLRISREDTPHDSVSRRRTSTDGVKAMMGTSGRWWEISRAENPDCVKATMARGRRSAW